jgi:PleD family two-component response regulator
MLESEAGARVLVVDDQEPNALVLQRLLQRHGMSEVQMITDPRLVVDRLPELRPDLVLLDLYMPYVDGFTLLGHLRGWAGSEYLPVIVLTADTTPETLRRALDVGATDFLTKPFNATEIAIRVHNLLHTRRLYLALTAAGLDAPGPGPTGPARAPSDPGRERAGRATITREAGDEAGPYGTGVRDRPPRQEAERSRSPRT